MTPTHAELEEQKKTLAIDTTPLSDSFLAMIKKTKTTELMDQQDKLVEIGAGMEGSMFLDSVDVCISRLTREFQLQYAAIGDVLSSRLADRREEDVCG